MTLESGERSRNTDTKPPVTPKSTPQAEAKCKPRRSPQIQPTPCCGVKVHSPDLSPAKQTGPVAVNHWNRNKSNWSRGPVPSASQELPEGAPLPTPHPPQAPENEALCPPTGSCLAGALSREGSLKGFSEPFQQLSQGKRAAGVSGCLGVWMALGESKASFLL